MEQHPDVKPFKSPINKINGVEYTCPYCKYQYYSTTRPNHVYAVAKTHPRWCRKRDK